MFSENPMPDYNQSCSLSFSNDWIESLLVTAPRDLPVNDAIVVNLSTSPIIYAAGAHVDSALPHRYLLILNLWYTPEETDCGIHTEHQFLEVHTQVLGTGHMQKFRENKADTLHEDVTMPPGFTHDPFFTLRSDATFSYPRLRYYSDTDCIWMAIELHPSDCCADRSRNTGES